MWVYTVSIYLLRHRCECTTEIIERGCGVEKLIRHEAQSSALSGFDTIAEFNNFHSNMYTSVNGALTGL